MSYILQSILQSLIVCVFFNLTLQIIVPGKYIFCSNLINTISNLGTKWCGRGNIATNFSDLGHFRSTDYCCRNHDLCQVKISANSSKYGLINTANYTKMHCSCDTDFYACLKYVDNILAISVGIVYFNIIQPKCFRKDYPIVQCLDKQRYVSKTL